MEMGVICRNLTLSVIRSTAQAFESHRECLCLALRVKVLILVTAVLLGGGGDKKTEKQQLAF
jgi:hypothetical protein